ncbi:MAG: SAM-dependent chlorinase/fluorinase [Chloroflexi bacterium]|nr:SAM-dependent chlorinase/fluorinase [Chloroflexota bacterium]
MSIITLTTDFGTADSYVAAMKGVILDINPRATIIDVSHNIEPQNIAQAAFVLETVYCYFPADTIHVVVVDPGVGTSRRAVLLITPKGLFVAPDNGVLSCILDEALPDSATDRSKVSSPMLLLPRRLTHGLKAIALTNPNFWRHPVSPTFHGRDIFAPVAAHLSLGVAARELGRALPSLLTFSPPHPLPLAEGELIGHIIHIDHFGNLITDVKKEDIPWEGGAVEIKGRVIPGLSTIYAEGDQLVALIGSSGRLEIAAKGGNAARLLGTQLGDEIRLRL